MNNELEPPPDASGVAGLFLKALTSFISEHSTVQSSVIRLKVREKLEAAESYYAAIIVPLDLNIFSFETAVQWAYFVYHVWNHLKPIPGTPFDLEGLFTEIARRYDIATQIWVWDNLE